MPKTLNCYKIYQSAKAEAKTGDVYHALTGMQQVLEAYPDSIPAAELAIELAMDYGYYDYGAYLINEYMVGKEVKDNTYSKITMYSNRLSRYYNTYDKMEEISLSLDEGMSEEAVLVRMKGELLVCLDDPEQYPALIYYYLGNLSQDSEEAAGYLEADRTQGMEYIQKAYDGDPEAAYIKETIIIALMENGRTEEAEALKKQFDEAGEVFDGEFAGYLDGSITLHDYYVDEE